MIKQKIMYQHRFVFKTIASKAFKIKDLDAITINVKYVLILDQEAFSLKRPEI
jgi:hypothetical protein